MPSRQVFARRRALWVLSLALATATTAAAADRTVLGQKLLVQNPQPDDAGRRKIIASARETSSAEALVGDPTLAGGSSGAVLGLVVNGGTSTARAWRLPQGTTASGKPFWRATGTGFRYADPDGEQGPVRSVAIKRTATGTFQLRAELLGRIGVLDVVPPNPGIDGMLALALAGGDRYCAAFGPEGTSRNDGERLWKIKKVTAESCAMAGELSFLTYNVAGLPQGISSSDPEVNTPLIAPLLNGYDLVVVEESWETPDPNPLAPLRVYHEILRAGTDHPYKSDSKPNPLSADPSRPSAILSDGLNRFSRFPFGPLLREAWAGCDNTAADCLALKGFSMARTTLAPGVEVDVYNLHMEAGGSANDDALRDAGVTQMLAFMATHSAGRAIIMGGDFNLHTDEEPDATTYQRLVDEGGLTDVCAFVGCAIPSRIEKVLFRSSDTVTLTALDWHLPTDVFQRQDGEPLSDHPPLAVRFRWQAVTD